VRKLAAKILRNGLSHVDQRLANTEIYARATRRRPNRDALFEYVEFVCYGANPKA
jgi:hypothetical protein